MQFIRMFFVSKRLKFQKKVIPTISCSDHNWKDFQNDTRLLKDPFKAMR